MFPINYQVPHSIGSVPHFRQKYFDTSLCFPYIDLFVVARHNINTDCRIWIFLFHFIISNGYIFISSYSFVQGIDLFRLTHKYIYLVCVKKSKVTRKCECFYSYLDWDGGFRTDLT